MAQGQANKDLATSLNVTESGVKNVLQQLFTKTEVHSRSQLVRVALERYRDLLKRLCPNIRGLRIKASRLPGLFHPRVSAFGCGTYLWSASISVKK